jgi:hypothetical protein
LFRVVCFARPKGWTRVWRSCGTMLERMGMAKPWVTSLRRSFCTAAGLALTDLWLPHSSMVGTSNWQSVLESLVV